MALQNFKMWDKHIIKIMVSQLAYSDYQEEILNKYLAIKTRLCKLEMLYKYIAWLIRETTMQSNTKSP